MKLDLTGGNPENFKKTIVSVKYKSNEACVITPQRGLFHTSMKSPIVTRDGIPLEYNRDYLYIYSSKDVRNKYNVSAHGGILVLTNDKDCQIEITANYLGGEYQTHTTEYIQGITTLDFLFSKFKLDSINNIPDTLPPKASLLDINSVTSGMNASTRIIYNLGLHLIEYEVGKPKPSNGLTWPYIDIGDIPPPGNINITIDEGAGSSIPEAELTHARVSSVPLGAIPIGSKPFHKA